MLESNHELTSMLLLKDWLVATETIHLLPSECVFANLTPPPAQFFQSKMQKPRTILEGPCGPLANVRPNVAEGAVKFLHPLHQNGKPGPCSINLAEIALLLERLASLVLPRAPHACSEAGPSNDHGSGLAMRHLVSCFNRFFQVDEIAHDGIARGFLGQPACECPKDFGAKCDRFPIEAHGQFAAVPIRLDGHLGPVNGAVAFCSGFVPFPFHCIRDPHGFRGFLSGKFASFLPLQANQGSAFFQDVGRDDAPDAVLAAVDVRDDGPDLLCGCVDVDGTGYLHGFGK